MNTNPWYTTHSYLPPEKVLVETKISDHQGERNFANLIRQGNLWFMSDMKMYVYYRPTHWRRIQ